MRKFQLRFTGDYLDQNGNVAYGDIGRAALSKCAWIEIGFLSDQKPEGESYWDRLYSLEIKASSPSGCEWNHHLQALGEGFRIRPRRRRRSGRDRTRRRRLRQDRP